MSLQSPAAELQAEAPSHALPDGGLGTPLSPQPAPLSTRLLSLDVYRGLIMVTLAFNGFGLAATAVNHLKENVGPAGFWQTVYFHTEHAEWIGGGYWDMIQPSFMFMVGAAMAFSYAKRQRLGDTYGQLFGHAVSRSLILIFLGIFLAYGFGRDGWSITNLGNWGFMNVLTQIGLGYTFLFLLWGRPVAIQALAAAGILAGTWLLYVLLPGSYTEVRDAGLGLNWIHTHLAGTGEAWYKCANVGQEIDVWLLNSLPRTDEYVNNRGGYQTINFIPSLATMIFGLMCGELMRSKRSSNSKLLILAAAGLLGLTLGFVLHQAGVCPLVKRIWTPAWALWSTGWCCLILAFLFAVTDILGYQRWAFPLVVVGMNSIAIYAMCQLLKGVVAWPFKEIFGPTVFTDWAGLWGPALQFTLIGLVFWLICYAMYRLGIFVRI